MDCWPFFLKVERSTSFVLLLCGSQVLGLKFVFYGKFGFSRPDLDGNEPGKGKCLVRKMRDEEVFNSFCLSRPGKGKPSYWP